MATSLSKPPVDNYRPNKPTKPILKRSDVARMIGMSVSSVRRLEWTGVLHPKKSGGVWLFDIEEVQELAPRKARPRKIQRETTGQRAAACFQCFSKGNTLIQIVEFLKMDPEEIQRLYALYEKNDLRAQLDAEHQARLERSRR